MRPPRPIDVPAAYVAAQIIRRTTTAVRRHLKLVRREPTNVELVHRLRVWTRRAVVALDFFAPLYPEMPRRQIWKRLRKVRRRAGRVRDCDVLLAKYPSNAADVHKDRRRAVRPLIDNARKPLRRRLKRQVRKLLPQVIEQQTKFRAFAAHRLAAVQADLFAADPGPTGNIKALHQLRLRAKALRYSLEFIAAVAGTSQTETALAALSSLQEALGALTDAALVEAQLQRIPRPTTLDDQRAYHERAAQAYAEVLQKMAAFHLIWTPTYRTQLQTALAAVAAELSHP